MKKTILITFLLTLLSHVSGWAQTTISGNGNTGTISIADINNQGLSAIASGTGWVLSLDVENPNGVSFNNWGSSILATGNNAFPEKNGFTGFQLYLQSSSNGSKLDAVFGGSDHIIDNITYVGNFSVKIIYDGDKNLMIETTNAANNKTENKYTLSTALPEISQFAYGLPSGINIKNLQIYQWSNDINYPTTATEQSGKLHFTSDKIWYNGACNKLRFTLIESGAYYKNGKNRFAFDSFVLYDINGTPLDITSDCISGNYSKNYANMLDGVNNTYCFGDWNSADEGNDYFEIILPESIELGGAFSFSFVTENTTMNVKTLRIEMSYEEKESSNYTLCLDVPQGHNITVSYSDEEVEDGHIFNQESLNAELFSATEISGYTWSVNIDEQNRTVTIAYTETVIIENPQSVVELINRIGSIGTANSFRFILDPSLNSRQEVFILDSEEDKILIKGNTISAITTGLGWYLNNYANINIAWNSLNEKKEGEAYADLSELPLPLEEEAHTCNAKYRYYLNYCTFGYSMATWTWKRWQQEIDWMALHGINMPLQIIGLEEVWRQFLTMESNGNRKYGYSDEEAKAFVAGPAFTAWWGMNNLEGWGGTKADGTGGVQDDAWYLRQTTLAKNILDRQRELGMQPVLPGFSGMVPTNFTTKTGVPTDANGGNWAGGFTRPRIIDPTYSGFAEIAADYYTCLKEIMGESKYYSMDPFHEGGSISSGKYTEAYKAIYDAMESACSGSQWVIQQWQWDNNQKLSINAVPAGRLIVLDLFSDGLPKFDTYSGYTPQDAVFCAIPNFGGRSGLMGRLNNLTDNYFTYKEKYASIKGIGVAPESIEQTPVTYDLIFQLAWMDSKPDVHAWIKRYATTRYGKENEVIHEAWDLLRQGVLNYGADAIQGPVEDVWAARPNLDARPASAWGKTLNHAGGIYTKSRRQMLIDATYKLLSQNESLDLASGSIYESNYHYDLVEFGGGVMADYAYDLLLGIKAAKEAAGDNFADDPVYKTRRDAFLALIEDMDIFKGTNLNFRLGKWTQEARDAAADIPQATTATPDWYEFNNARTLITTWSKPNTNLNDYSYRSWQGLLKDFYLPRWKYFFENNCANNVEYGYFEWNWAHGMEHHVGQTTKSTTRLTEGQPGYSYSREPEGNTIEEAKKLLDKYIIPITVENGLYYAYRYLENDLTNKVTIIANAGSSIDLTPYFGELENITVSGEYIKQGNDLSNVSIESDAPDGAYTGTLSMSDGTVLTFAIVLNPAYHGVYYIKYIDGANERPLFVGYNEDQDNSNNKGYKLIASGTYNTENEADKMFTIVPEGTGYSISAQGKYLKSPTLAGWNHIMFSDNSEEAGAYLFEETDINDIFLIRNTGEGINYINDYDNLVFGNDKSNKENLSTFTVTVAEYYPLTITDMGMVALCLPFNVVIPETMYAYDLASSDIEKGENEGEYICTLKPIAKSGETLKEGTPVIVKAEQGEYKLGINMSYIDAKTSLPGSSLNGNFVEETYTNTDINRFVLSDDDTHGIGFHRMQTTNKTDANSCWLEWATSDEEEAQLFILRFEDETNIDDIINNTQDFNSSLIYNINGQRLNNPQKGLNIIGNRKILVK